MPALQLAAAFMHRSQDSNIQGEREREKPNCALLNNDCNGQLASRTLVVRNFKKGGHIRGAVMHAAIFHNRTPLYKLKSRI